MKGKGKKRSSRGGKSSNGSGNGQGGGRPAAAPKRFNPDDPLGLNSDEDAASDSLSQMPLALR